MIVEVIVTINDHTVTMTTRAMCRFSRKAEQIRETVRGISAQTKPLINNKLVYCKVSMERCLSKHLSKDQILKRDHSLPFPTKIVRDT